MIREDLPIGVAAAQITHAAGESVESKVPAGTYAIVLGVKDETSLRVLVDKLAAKSVAFSAITETSELYDGQLMSVGLKPIWRSIGRKILSSYPLYKGPTSGGVV